jgi:hypothetical protein
LGIILKLFFFNVSMAIITPLLRVEPRVLHIPSSVSSLFVYLFITFIVVGGGTLWYLQKFLQYVILESTPSSILLYCLIISNDCVVYHHSLT